jgi:spore coat polysaccharide biosynthesis protein SpsF
MLKYAIAIVARSNSRRLPNKILRKIGETSVLDILIRQVSLIDLNIPVFLVTSTSPTDDKLVEYAQKKISVFRGDENNLFKRLDEFSNYIKCMNLICVLGDNPIIDHNLGMKLIQEYEKKDLSYVCLLTNEYELVPKSYGRFPVGTRIQIISSSEVMSVDPNTLTSDYKEHPWKYFSSNINQKKFSFLPAEGDLKHLNRPELNFSINHEKDLIMLNQINEILTMDKKAFTLAEVLVALDDKLSGPKSYNNL